MGRTSKEAKFLQAGIERGFLKKYVEKYDRYFIKVESFSCEETINPMIEIWQITVSFQNKILYSTYDSDSSAPADAFFYQYQAWARYTLPNLINNDRFMKLLYGDGVVNFKGHRFARFRWVQMNAITLNDKEQIDFLLNEIKSKEE
jgi:hypothetical protein